MRANGIAKLYDNLTVDERFRLRIQAFARRDMVECERLDRTCPGSDFRGYCARIDASEVLTLITLAELLPLLAKLTMIDAVAPLVQHLETKQRDAAWLAYLNGMRAGWEAAGRRSSPPDVSDDELDAATASIVGSATDWSDLLEQLAHALATRARASRDGMATFADDRMGLSFDVLVQAWGGHSKATIDGYADTLNSAPSNDDGLSLLLRVMDLSWRRHGLLDSTAEPDDDLRAAITGAGWPPE